MQIEKVFGMTDLRSLRKECVDKLENIPKEKQGPEHKEYVQVSNAAGIYSELQDWCNTDTLFSARQAIKVKYTVERMSQSGLSREKSEQIMALACLINSCRG